MHYADAACMICRLYRLCERLLIRRGSVHEDLAGLVSLVDVVKVKNLRVPVGVSDGAAWDGA